MLNPNPLDFPFADGRVVTQGHADRCAQQGHAKHEVNGRETGICPRCGDLNGRTPGLPRVGTLHVIPFAVGSVVMAHIPHTLDGYEAATVTELPEGGPVEVITATGQLAHLPALLIERHADYPHEVGYLIGCRACESGCNCVAVGRDLDRVEPCVWCQEQQAREALMRADAEQHAQPVDYGD